MCGRGIAVFVLSVPLWAQHGSSTTVNPYTGPDHAAAGARLYKVQCAGCHGGDGTGGGNGPEIASGNYKRGGADEHLFHTITNGVPGTAMPAFKLSGLQTWQLVTHLRSLVVARGPALTTGDVAAGEALYRANCHGCHEGGMKGPDLSAVGSRLSLAELRTAVLEPQAAVASEYWSVAIRTPSGEKFSGIRLNEDTHSVQFRDGQGRLRSVMKQGADIQLIRRSPMPGFGGKLSAQQMQDLLAYVITLRGTR